MGDAPGFADVLGTSLARGQQHVALLQRIQLWAVHLAQEMQRRCVVEVERLVAIEEALQIVRPRQTDGGAEDIGVTARDRERIVRTNRGAGGEDLDAGILAIHAHGGNDFAVHELVELVLHLGTMAVVAFAFDPGAAGDAVARIDLDALGFEERCQRIDHQEALDLLGIPAGGGEEQDRRADVAPAHDIHILMQTLRVPAGVDLRHATASLRCDQGSPADALSARDACDLGRLDTGFAALAPAGFGAAGLDVGGFDVGGFGAVLLGAVSLGAAFAGFALGSTTAVVAAARTAA